MLTLLVAILPLLLAIFSPTWPKMFRNRPRQPPRCLRHRQDSPQDASDTSSEPPKSAKNQRKPMVFQCFSLSSPSPKILQKCSQNCPRTSQVELKMPILALSWPILALSWPILALSWPILDGTCRQLDPNFAHLAPILPQLREKFSPKRAKDPKKRPKSAQDPPSLAFSLISCPSGS